MTERPTLLEQDMTDAMSEVTALLQRTSPEALLKAYASLTHRLHATVEINTTATLRVERGLVEEELLRRLHAAQPPA